MYVKSSVFVSVIKLYKFFTPSNYPIITFSSLLRRKYDKQFY